MKKYILTVEALSPVHLGAGKSDVIIDAETAHDEFGMPYQIDNGEIILTEIQLEGKKKMRVSDYLNGLQNKDSLVGKILE